MMDNNIYVDDIGKGFPFVFVHGYLGSSEMWCYQKEFFSKNFRVIVPALPGFGESYKSKSLNSINDMAKKIIELAAELDYNAQGEHLSTTVFMNGNEEYNRIE